MSGFTDGHGAYLENPADSELEDRPRKMLVALPHNGFRWFGVRVDWCYRQRDLVFYAWWSERVWSKSLRDIIAPPPSDDPVAWEWKLSEAFAAKDKDGNITHIGYKGEWYTPVKATWRVRLHNWLVRKATR